MRKIKAWRGEARWGREKEREGEKRKGVRETSRAERGEQGGPRGRHGDVRTLGEMKALHDRLPQCLERLRRSHTPAPYRMAERSKALPPGRRPLL